VPYSPKAKYTHHRRRVPSDFVDDSFRTLPASKARDQLPHRYKGKKGIKVVMGRLKEPKKGKSWVIQSVLVPKKYKLRKTPMEVRVERAENPEVKPTDLKVFEMEAALDHVKDICEKIGWPLKKGYPKAWKSKGLSYTAWAVVTSDDGDEAYEFSRAIKKASGLAENEEPPGGKPVSDDVNEVITYYKWIDNAIPEPSPPELEKEIVDISDWLSNPITRVGDEVFIKPKDELEQQDGVSFEHLRYAGKTAKIYLISRSPKPDGFYLDIDKGKLFWTRDMVEYSIFDGLFDKKEKEPAEPVELEKEIVDISDWLSNPKRIVPDFLDVDVHVDKVSEDTAERLVVKDVIAILTDEEMSIEDSKKRIDEVYMGTFLKEDDFKSKSRSQMKYKKKHDGWINDEKSVVFVKKGNDKYEPIKKVTEPGKFMGISPMGLMIFGDGVEGTTINPYNVTWVTGVLKGDIQIFFAPGGVKFVGKNGSIMIAPLHVQYQIYDPDRVKNILTKEQISMFLKKWLRMSEPEESAKPVEIEKEIVDISDWLSNPKQKWKEKTGAIYAVKVLRTHLIALGRIPKEWQDDRVYWDASPHNDDDKLWMWTVEMGEWRAGECEPTAKIHRLERQAFKYAFPHDPDARNKMYLSFGADPEDYNFGADDKDTVHKFYKELLDKVNEKIKEEYGPTDPIELEKEVVDISEWLSNPDEYQCVGYVKSRDEGGWAVNLQSKSLDKKTKDYNFMTLKANKDQFDDIESIRAVGLFFSDLSTGEFTDPADWVSIRDSPTREIAGTEYITLNVDENEDIFDMDGRYVGHMYQGDDIDFVLNIEPVEPPKPPASFEKEVVDVSDWLSNPDESDYKRRATDVVKEIGKILWGTALRTSWGRESWGEVLYIGTLPVSNVDQNAFEREAVEKLGYDYDTLQLSADWRLAISDTQSKTPVDPQSVYKWYFWILQQLREKNVMPDSAGSGIREQSWQDIIDILDEKGELKDSTFGGFYVEPARYRKVSLRVAGGGRKEAYLQLDYTGVTENMPPPEYPVAMVEVLALKHAGLNPEIWEGKWGQRVSPNWRKKNAILPMDGVSPFYPSGDQSKVIENLYLYWFWVSQKLKYWYDQEWEDQLILAEQREEEEWKKRVGEKEVVDISTWLSNPDGTRTIVNPKADHLADAHKAVLEIMDLINWKGKRELFNWTGRIVLQFGRRKKTLPKKYHFIMIAEEGAMKPVPFRDETVNFEIEALKAAGKKPQYDGEEYKGVDPLWRNATLHYKPDDKPRIFGGYSYPCGTPLQVKKYWTSLKIAIMLEAEEKLEKLPPPELKKEVVDISDWLSNPQEFSVGDKVKVNEGLQDIQKKLVEKEKMGATPGITMGMIQSEGKTFTIVNKVKAHHFKGGYYYRLGDDGFTWISAYLSPAVEEVKEKLPPTKFIKEVVDISDWLSNPEYRPGDLVEYRRIREREPLPEHIRGWGDRGYEEFHRELANIELEELEERGYKIVKRGHTTGYQGGVYATIITPDGEELKIHWNDFNQAFMKDLPSGGSVGLDVYDKGTIESYDTSNDEVIYTIDSKKVPQRLIKGRVDTTPKIEKEVVDISEWLSNPKGILIHRVSSAFNNIYNILHPDENLLLLYGKWGYNSKYGKKGYYFNHPIKDETPVEVDALLKTDEGFLFRGYVYSPWRKKQGFDLVENVDVSTPMGTKAEVTRYWQWIYDRLNALSIPKFEKEVVDVSDWLSNPWSDYEVTTFDLDPQAEIKQTNRSRYFVDVLWEKEGIADVIQGYPITLVGYSKRTGDKIFKGKIRGEPIIIRNGQDDMNKMMTYLATGQRTPPFNAVFNKGIVEILVHWNYHTEQSVTCFGIALGFNLSSLMNLQGEIHRRYPVTTMIVFSGHSWSLYVKGNRNDRDIENMVKSATGGATKTSGASSFTMPFSLTTSGHAVVPVDNAGFSPDVDADPQRIMDDQKVFDNYMQQFAWFFDFDDRYKGKPRKAPPKTPSKVKSKPEPKIKFEKEVVDISDWLSNPMGKEEIARYVRREKEDELGDSEFHCLEYAEALRDELIKRGYPAKVVRGTFITKEPIYIIEDDEDVYERDHYWVISNGDFIDITADQFIPWMDDRFAKNLKDNDFVLMDEDFYGDYGEFRTKNPELVDIATAFGIPPKGYKFLTIKDDAKRAREYQDNRFEYYHEILPKVYKTYLGFPVSFKQYSKRSGELNLIRNDMFGKPMVWKDDQDALDWIKGTGRWTKQGNKRLNRGVIDLYVAWNYKDPTVGIIDFDRGPEISEKEVRPYVLKAEKILKKKGYKTLITFTGSSYHVFFKTTEPYDVVKEVIREIAEVLDLPFGGRGEKLHVGKKLTVDYAVSSRNRPIRVPFSLHKSGLVDIPLTPKELEDFNPGVDAHPDEVLKKFNKYYKRADKFFR
jgi:hypothetical protein